MPRNIILTAMACQEQAHYLGYTPDTTLAQDTGNRFTLLKYSPGQGQVYGQRQEN